jgi:hypothetical protein
MTYRYVGTLNELRLLHIHINAPIMAASLIDPNW